MPPNINWKEIIKIDPDELPRQEELADNLLISLSKMKAQEVELALEEVEKAGEEQAKFENQLKTKVMKLENELEMAQQSAGGRDTRFLRDEIRQLEKQLEQKDRELEDMEKELEKEKKVNEQLALRNEEAENENSKLRRENEQLRQDIIDYQKQIDSQKESLLSRRGEDSDYRSQLSKKNYELVQYLDEIQTLTEANEKIEVQNQEMRKNLEESVQEMEKMTDEYNRMKAIVHQTDNIMDQLKKENDHYRLQVKELTDLLKAKNEEDDPIMVAVNAKVEEWKLILSSKDDEIIEYQQMLHNLKEKLKNAQLDADKSNIMALQQGIQDRDSQIKMLTEQVEQYTKEMEKNTFIIEDLRNELQRSKGASSLSQQNHFMKIQSKVQILEEKTKEAERTAELAESDAREKDKELFEALKRLKDYESGVYGLEDAVVEIKNYKNQVKIRDREIEELTKEINKLELKINDFLDENEALRERVGLEPKTMIDLTEFRNSKRLKQQQYRAENQILLKEARLTIEDLNLTEDLSQGDRIGERKLNFVNLKNMSETQSKNEFLSRELIEKERDLERSRTVINKFQNKLKELVEENKQLEEGMKEILQAIKEMQKDPDIKGSETSLIIPSLERLVNAIESKNAEGIFDASLHLKAQVDQLTGRNEELRQELKESRKEAINYSQQLAKANLKIDHLEKETNLLRQSEGSNVVFKGVDLPDGIAPSSANIINSQNEYLIHLLQELESKEKKLKNLEDSLEDYNRKFAVLRHQQSLLYKEYLSEKETWKTESETIKEEKKKLEDQIQQDAIKVKEYNNLLSALQMDSDEMRKTLSENSRKITVLQVNEKSLIRRYTTLVEMERQLRKENGKQKNDLMSMEAEVCEKIGCLQRFKLTKINLDAQRVEQMLRDELADSVSKAVSDADRQRILELEKNEMELKVEVSKLREISDIAKRQVEILNSQQQSREKEVESLRMQLVEYQAQSDEKALIAKLHQHLVSLQISEATALSKLESVTSKLQKIETYNLRLEQKLDEKEQTLYYARLEGRNRTKHLRQTIQSLRRQFSGALPLAQQEKFSKTMIQLQNDKLKIMEEMKNSRQEHRNMENKALEMELKLRGLEELISTLKDARGAQKVINWHMKIEEHRLQELKLNRELVKDKEEIKYLNNIISEYEHTISSLEEEIVQQNKFHEERQMAWDQREVELERQLDIFDRQQNEILNAAQKFEEATGSMPDPSLPLPNQLEIALRKLKENIRIILETRATCKSLEEKLKEKESALQLAEQNILSRDKVINELRLRLPVTAEQEKLLSELGKKDMEPKSHYTMKIAHQTIANMQARLNQKEEVLKKYQHLLEKAREEQREIVKKHEEDLLILHHKLELQADSSLSKFKQTAWDLIKQSPTPVPTNKHFIRLAEMEQTVAEQDDSLSSLLIKLKKVSQDLERQKEITELKIQEFENVKLRLQENHAGEVKKVKAEVEDLRCLLAHSQKESQSLKSELEAQKEANSRAPTTTMKNLVERLKSQLALKEKQQKALSRALLELRAEMTAAAEEHIISITSQKEANLNVQQIVDRHTRELKSQIEDLNENLLKLKEALKTSKSRENSLTDNLNDLNNELQKTQKAYNKVLREKDGIDQENDELKRQIKRLTNGLQSRPLMDNKQSLIEELQKKVKKLESQLERKVDEVDLKPVKEKSAREELIRWEEGKKWQTKIEGIRNKLKEKEREVYTITKQLNTLKDLFAKADKEKLTLQKKLKTTGMTVDQVMGVRALESEKELEELKKRNLDLENDILYMKTHQALPRDSVVEDLHLQNKYLQEKLHALEKQFSKDAYSRPSTSEIESDEHCQKEQELQKENLKLSSENIELKFQLEQANKDLPRLKNQVRDLKEMCEFLKKGKFEVERKLGHVRGSGRSGKTIPELEKTIGLMKKVVEKVQRENEQLKRASGILTSEKMANIELENEKLKAELEKLKVHLGRELSMHYESKTKGTEKIVAENERLRKELKKETETAEKLRIAKNNLEILNEKMTVQLEEISKRLQLAESRGPQLEGADSKSWKSIVVTRMYETKLKELEADIAKKNQSITDLKQLVREATEREQKVKKYNEDLEQQACSIEILKHVPEGTETEQDLKRELQVLRLANNQLNKEKAELIHQIEDNKDQSGVESTTPDADQLKEQIKDLETQIKISDLEKQHLKEEIKKLKKELENFDPSFFEEIEDLKYNYKEEVKKNILLEEKLKNLSEQFGVELSSPVPTSEQSEDEESPVNFPIY
ncbi:Centrosomal protein of 290 kDa [Sciurus carolinensis]|uniref:Centrosomal protein of 290 kDa n=1 Tax=Sciurus carolinensis TaxID=30640 RepID=A0AA41MVA8_SCICA|nr:Centrosomal protein of 290 kDa [Sciurus carolinensis]